MRRVQYGLTLIELLVSVALSIGVSLLLIQLHLQSSLALEKQQLSIRSLENAAALQHILAHTVRDALYSVQFTVTLNDSEDAPASSIFANHCAGVATQHHCSPPLLVWTAGEEGEERATPSAALDGSSVLQLKHKCCAEVVADQFFLAHRGNLEANPISLYRRRLQIDGSYTSAVELVEGVVGLTASFIIEDDLVGGLALVGWSGVTDWWQLKAVRIQFSLQDPAAGHMAMQGNVPPLNFSFTVASRQWQQMPDEAHNE